MLFDSAEAAFVSINNIDVCEFESDSLTSSTLDIIDVISSQHPQFMGYL